MQDRDKEMKELWVRFKLLRFVQTQAIYHYTGYTRSSVHDYRHDIKTPPKVFLDKFRMMIEEYEHAQNVLNKHLVYID